MRFRSPGPAVPILREVDSQREGEGIGVVLRLEGFNLSDHTSSWSPDYV
jgi:hypothetical protein